MKVIAFLTDGPSKDACAQAFSTLPSKVIQGGAVDAVGYLKENPSPDFLIVEVPSADAAPAMLDQLADVVAPETKVVITGKIDTFRFYQWLKDIGVHGYLLEPFTAAQLQEILKEAPARGDKSEAKKPSKVVAFIGARGGVGATTIVANTGYIIATEQKKPTAIIDLDLHFGALALTHDIEPSRGLQDALEKPDRIDGLFLDRVMTKYVDNLYLLSAEEPLHEATPHDANAAEKLLLVMREKFEVILVDLPHVMTPLTRAVLLAADEVIIVSELSLGSLRDALRIKDYVVEQLHRPAPKIISNREGMYGKHELKLADFEKHIGTKISAHVPFTADIFVAATQGELAAKAVKHVDVQKALHAVVQLIVGAKKPADGAKPQAKPLLGGLFAPKKA
ncbi:MAG: AAA family ATPase [Alphaproteobacteria bacterium]|nr:AAA family ATPase [Alphaproteobacteria bacterium]